ncbi:MAG: CapA family protein [Lachnospiraceae bacterium]|nr:CapA family protein [Lachnospiraceae bacterium]
MKITFLGDLTADRRMLAAAKQPDGHFDFAHSLQHIPATLKESDAVIGNLETVFGGADKGYNPWPIAYNSPDELLQAFRDMGVTVLTTANNHSLDQGKKGLLRTLDLIDGIGIAHTGTFRTADEPRYLVLNVGGIRIGLAAFADALNRTAAGVQQADNAMTLVNHIKPYGKRGLKGDLIAALATFLPIKEVRAKQSRKRSAAGIKSVKPRVDNVPLTDKDRAEIEKAAAVLDLARAESDYVVASIHTGGQFNGEPGIHSQEIYEILKPHADAIMGNHAHVAQRIETYGPGVLAYALGGFNMSVGAEYVTADDHPEFSVGVHLYLEKDETGAVRLQKAAFTLYFIEEDETGYLTVYPVDTAGGKGDNDAMRTVFRRIAGYDFPGFMREYPIHFA